jgi:hypothetical protein
LTDLTFVWPVSPVAGDDAHCDVFFVGLNKPFQADDLLSGWPSWIPRVWSLPSGQNVFTQQPTGLVFTLVWVALWHYTAFAFALS